MRRIETVVLFSNSGLGYLVSAEEACNNSLVVGLSTNYNYNKRGLFGVIESSLAKSYEDISQNTTK